MFRKKNNKNFKSAFTLVELLVVIAIIGILATLAIVAIQNTRAKARDTKRIADVKQIQTALELYFNDNGSYPVSSSVTSSIRSASRVYMEMYPQAPNPPDGDCTESNNQYVYTETGEDNGSYTLFFCLGGTNSGISSGLAVASPVGVEYGSFENLKVGLIGHWALDNIDGVVDKSTSGNNGTGVGGVTIGGATDRHGQANGATSFDGVNDYIDCGAFTQIDGIQKMTMVYWGKKSATNKLLPIGKRSDSSANASAIALNVWNDGLIYWNVSEFPVVRAGRCSFNDTNWHLFTMVFDGSLSGNENRLKGYIDGIQQSLFFTGTIPTSLTSIAGNMYIGASSQSIATYYGSGSISDVRVYNRALSEEEIQQLYLLEN